MNGSNLKAYVKEPKIYTEKPEEYSEAFEKAVNKNKDTIEAIRIACTKPSDMTRTQLKELKLTLNKQNFTESNLKQAISTVKNEEIVADIIAHVCRAVLHMPIRNHEVKVKMAFKKLIEENIFNKIQLHIIKKLKPICFTKVS